MFFVHSLRIGRNLFCSLQINMLALNMLLWSIILCPLLTIFFPLQRRKVDYDDGRERTRGRSPAGRRQSRSPDETRRRITNKGSRSRSRSPPGQLASSRLMDMSDSSRKSVKDRLGPRLGGGSSTGGSKKGFDQDHWRGGASAPDGRKKLGREERKQQSR